MKEMTLKQIIESILFVSDSPLSLDRLYILLEEFEHEDIKGAVAALADECNVSRRAIELIQVAGGYQFRSRSEFADYIRRLKKLKPVRFSPSALETLAIIAYRQPVTRSEIEYFRGVDSGGILKSLLDKKLIRIIGKKDIPGKPLIYGTTREFMETFSLKDLASLPTLREIEELAVSGDDMDQVPLPLPEM
ncbi:MAG: SMC-Scp complex subunit ScpB [Geobacteraceae bacterium]|nr:SMC-Scp complex subunit ScpB [Geobacteraceae bacterium]